MFYVVTVTPKGRNVGLDWFFDSPEQVAQAAEVITKHGARRSEFWTVPAVPLTDFVTDAFELDGWLGGRS